MDYKLKDTRSLYHITVLDGCLDLGSYLVIHVHECENECVLKVRPTCMIYLMIFSSSVPFVMSLYTFTTFFWPIRWARSIAYVRKYVEYVDWIGVRREGGKEGGKEGRGKDRKRGGRK